MYLLNGVLTLDGFWLGGFGRRTQGKWLKSKSFEERSGTNIGKAVERIQQLLPNARFVYATATFGTTPEDLRYVQRLGLWDEGAGF